MDIRHILKYKYIPVNVRKSNLKCGNYEISFGAIINKWLTVVTNEELREWIRNHPPVQVPSLSILEYCTWILTSRGVWITVHHYAKRKRTSIICVANLHSLPWNITSKAHKIRTTLKRRWIFKRASGNRCLHDAGKTRPPRKAAAAAAAAAAILCQYIREQSPTTEKKRILREDRIWTMIPGWHTWRRHSFEILIFKYVYFDTMIDVTVKKREQRIGMLYFQYWEWEKCTKFPNHLEREFTCEDWSHCLYRRSFKSVNWDDIRAIRRP